LSKKREEFLKSLLIDWSKSCVSTLDPVPTFQKRRDEVIIDFNSGIGCSHYQCSKHGVALWFYASNFWSIPMGFKSSQNYGAKCPKIVSASLENSAGEDYVVNAF